MKYKDINDYELLYLAQENDELAYNTIYLKYKPLIGKFAQEYYFKNKDIGIEYDDLYQEGILSLENAIAHYQDKASLFYTFVIICIRRDMEKIIKAAKRYKHMVLNEAYSLNKPLGNEEDMTLEDILFDNHNIAQNYIEEENYDLLRNDFKHSLSIEYSAIYELKINNFSNKEIAQLLEVEYKMVDNILRTIKSKLRKYQSQIEKE